MEARIGQYDKCLEGVLVLPNIWATTILVIGNMYRYIEKVPFGDQKSSLELIFSSFPREA